MISRMNAIHDAARLAMADHRAAAPRPRPPRRGLFGMLRALAGAFLAAVLRRVSAPD